MAVKPTTPVLDTGHSRYATLHVAIPFTEGSGTAVADLKGNFSGTATDASGWTTVSGEGPVWETPDTVQYVDIGALTTALNAEAAWTIHARVGFNTGKSLTTGSVSRLAGIAGGYRMSQNADGGDTVYLQVTDQGFEGKTGPARQCLDGTFHSLTVTKDATAELKFYYDGTLVSTLSWSASSDNIRALTAFLLGAESGSTGDFLPGLRFSDFKVWTSDLTLAAIADEHSDPWALYNGSVAPDAPTGLSLTRIGSTVRIAHDKVTNAETFRYEKAADPGGPWTTLTTADKDPVFSPPNKASPLALNLQDTIDWSTDVAFADLMKQSRAWVGATLSTFDSDDWPDYVEPGETLIAYIDTTRKLPAGTYDVYATGVGTFTITGGVTGWTDLGGGHYQFTYTQGVGDLRLNITDTNVSTPLRVAVVLPGHAGTYETNPWNSDFLDFCEHFEALRFLAPLRAFPATMTSLSGWNTLTSRSYAKDDAVRGGWPFELIPDLCNRLSCDAYVNVPPRLQDADFQTIATKLLALNSDRELTIALGNEYWNGITVNGPWFETEGEADPIIGATYTGFDARVRYYAKRSAECMDVFTSVWDGRTDKLRRTYEAQAANTGTYTQGLDWVLEDASTAHEHFDAVAGAPYGANGYNASGDVAQVTAWTVEELIAAHISDITSDMVSVSNVQGIATTYNKELVLYEFGQHMAVVGHTDATVIQRFIDANRHADLADWVQQYLDAIRSELSAIPVMACWYASLSTYGQSGCWGLVEYQGDTTPKNTAVRTWVAENPRFYAEPTMDPGTHYIRAIAIDASLNESDPSASAQVVIPDYAGVLQRGNSVQGFGMSFGLSTLIRRE